MVSNLKV